MKSYKLIISIFIIFIFIIYSNSRIFTQNINKKKVNILLINSYHWKTPWQSVFNSTFLPRFNSLTSLFEKKVNLYIENLSVMNSIMDKESFINYLKTKYKKINIDLVLTNDNPALEFVANNRDQLFQNAQIFSFAYKNIAEKYKDLSGYGYITANSSSFYKTIETIKLFHPNLKKIYVVSSMADNSLIIQQNFIKELSNMPDPPKFVFFKNTSFDLLLNKLSNLEIDSVIVYLPFFEDNQGNQYIPQKVLEEIEKVSPVPIYSFWDTLMGKGIVGGNLLSAKAVGQNFADIAFKIIEGNSASSYRLVLDKLNQFIFDMRQIKKWNIDPSLIPKNSHIKFKNNSVFELYWEYLILIIIIFITQTIMILALIISLQKRKTLETKLKKMNENLGSIITARTISLNSLTRAVEQSSSMILITDAVGKIEYINPSFSSIMGYSLDEIKGKNPRIFKGNTKSNKFYEQLWNTILSGNFWKGEFYNKRKNGDLIWTLATITPVNDESGKLCNFVSIQEDITERKKIEERIRHLAYHDALTGLPSLRLAREKLKDALSYSKRNKLSCAVMFLDLDGFKLVNDTLGHDAGDQLLCNVANTLEATLRDSDTAARIGGDEFLIIQTNVKDIVAVETVADKLIKNINVPFYINDKEVRVGASLGIAIYPENGCDSEELLKKADQAMYKSKNRGKNSYTIADKEG